MTQEKFKNEKDIRRFLLGEMTASERIAFEEKFIAEDSELFDEISVTEDELIESYLRGTLPAVEKQRFEQNFLTTGARRQRVVFTRELFDKLAAEKIVAAKKIEAVAENPSLWKTLVNLFKTPRFAFGALLTILVLAFGFWFLILKPSEKRNELVRQMTPTPTVSNAPPKIDENQNSAPDSDVNSANKPEASKPPSNTNTENLTKNQPKEMPAKPVIATLTLFAGTIRSEGKMRELDLTKETKGANLQMNLESRDYQTYRAEIVDADGGVIYRSGKLRPQGSKINAFVSAKNLKKGDYLIKLYGFNSSGEEESVADFQFRVIPK